MRHNFESMDNVENIEKTENRDAEHNESIKDKAKNFFAEFFKKKEGNESTEEKNDKPENAKYKTVEERHNEFAESLRDGKSLDETMKEQAEIVKQFREKNGLDEHGYPTKDWKRPEGGFERDRVGDDPRWEDTESDNEHVNNPNELKNGESPDDE